MNDANWLSIVVADATTIAANLRVIINASGKAAVAGAADTKFIGTNRADVDAAQPSRSICAILRRSAGTHNAVYGSATALAAGDQIEGAANGKVTKLNAGTAIGVALEPATADGDQIRVLYY